MLLTQCVFLRSAPNVKVVRISKKRGQTAVMSTLAYIFPGQLEHKTPLVLLGVSGPGLRGTAAISPPFHNVGALSVNTLAHKTPSSYRYPWPPAAINSEGIASGPKARPDLGLERT